MKGRYLFILVALLLLIGFKQAGQLAVSLPSGIRAPNPPQQMMLSQPMVFTVNTLRVEGVARFHIRAKILSRREYGWDHPAKVSPLDLALGWDVMSDQAVVDKMQISQDHRWYYWHTPSWFVTRSQIEQNSANMHLIPATAVLKGQLMQVRVGEIVELDGYLVNVYDGPWRWISSLSRSDTGDGACEIIYVTRYNRIP